MSKKGAYISHKISRTKKTTTLSAKVAGEFVNHTTRDDLLVFGKQKNLPEHTPRAPRPT